MSELSDKLEGYIADSGLNVSKISRLTGIERTKILRLKNGKGHVTERELKQILSLLQLSQEEEEKMLVLHQMDVVGRDTYETRQSVKELLENIGQMRRNWVRVHELNHTQIQGTFLTKRERTVLITEDMVFHDAFYYAICKEVKDNENSCIRMDTFPGNENVLKLLIRLERESRNQIRCVQYVSFMKNTSEGAGVHNLEILKNIIPFIFTYHSSYQVKYTYTTASVDDTTTSLFPHFLLTKDCVLLLSEKADRMLFIEDAQMAGIFARECDTADRKYRNLLKSVDMGIESMISYYSNNVFVFGPEYIFESNPCIAFMIYPELIELEKDNIYLQQLYRYVLTVFDQKWPSCVDYFSWTIEMDEFLQTGRLPGVYGQYSRCFTPSERRRMLEYFIEFIENKENMQGCLMKDVRMEEGINIELYPDNKLSFHSVSNQYPPCIAMLDENGLCEIFRDYFESVKTSRSACTWEETKEFLYGKIREIPEDPEPDANA